MRLTLHADYGLRALVYLAAHPDRVVPTTEIGRAYGISKNHLVRVAQSLRDGGFIELSAGRSGGLRLARPASAIRVGDVVRTLEPDLRVVECFDARTSTCPISPVCGLSRALDGALAAFLAELDRFTIADAVARSGPQLRSHFLPAASLVRRPPPAPAANGKPAPGKSVSGKSVSGKSVSGKSVSGKPLSGKPGSGQPALPVSGKPVSARSVSGRPVSGKPATAGPA